MKVGSLFSGIGGFEAGFVQAGMDIAWGCEIDDKARAVLRRHHPGVKIYTDIKEMRGNAIEPVDVLCGGFPCQDLSVAGQRAGLAGKRSGLFHEITRLCRELCPQPGWLVLENVPGLLSSNGGRDMGAVIREIHGLGYRGGWRVLDLQWFGVPQRRRRVFFVFHLGDWRRAAEVLFESESLCGNPPPRAKKGKGVAALTANVVGTCGADDNQAQAGHLMAYPDPAYCLSAGPTGNQFGSGRDAQDVFVYGTRSSHAPAVAQTITADMYRSGGAVAGNNAQGVRNCLIQHMAVRRLLPVECERLQGFPDNYTAWGIDDAGNRVEMADSARYRMLGNAVGVPHSKWIGKRIREASA